MNCIFVSTDLLICPTTIDCDIDYFAGNITVKCSSSDTEVTCLQVLVQASKADEVHKLYVNHSDVQSTVTVEVGNGTYHVTVFPIREVNGILKTCPYTAIVSEGVYW